jgi:hypothetical protein
MSVLVGPAKYPSPTAVTISLELAASGPECDHFCRYSTVGATTTSPVHEPASTLRFAERPQRIDLCRSARRYVTRRHRYCCQQQWCTDEQAGIIRTEEYWIVRKVQPVHSHDKKDLLAERWARLPLSWKGLRTRMRGFARLPEPLATAGETIDETHRR